jgi:hypothetical protein
VIPALVVGKMAAGSVVAVKVLNNIKGAGVSEEAQAGTIKDGGKEGGRKEVSKEGAGEQESKDETSSAEMGSEGSNNARGTAGKDGDRGVEGAGATGSAVSEGDGIIEANNAPFKKEFLNTGVKPPSDTAGTDSALSSTWVVVKHFAWVKHRVFRPKL